MEEKKKERKNAGEDDIIIPYPGKIHLTRCYNYIPYTHWRIKRILKKEYNMELVPIGSYKCSRVPNYRQEYWLVDCGTGEIINERVTLDALRRIFAEEGFPEYDGESSQPGRPPPMPYGQGIPRSPPPFNQQQASHDAGNYHKTRFPKLKTMSRKHMTIIFREVRI